MASHPEGVYRLQSFKLAFMTPNHQEFNPVGSESATTVPSSLPASASPGLLSPSSGQPNHTSATPSGLIISGATSGSVPSLSNAGGYLHDISVIDSAIQVYLKNNSDRPLVTHDLAVFISQQIHLPSSSTNHRKLSNHDVRPEQAGDQHLEDNSPTQAENEDNRSYRDQGEDQEERDRNPPGQGGNSQGGREESGSGGRTLRARQGGGGGGGGGAGAGGPQAANEDSCVRLAKKPAKQPQNVPHILDTAPHRYGFGDGNFELDDPVEDNLPPPVLQGQQASGTYTLSDPRPEAFGSNVQHFIATIASWAKDSLLLTPDSAPTSMSSTHRLLHSLINGSCPLSRNLTSFSALTQEAISAAHNVRSTDEQEAKIHFIYWVNLLVFVACYNLCVFFCFILTI